jgi:hypothetical protein
VVQCMPLHLGKCWFRPGDSSSPVSDCLRNICIDRRETGEDNEMDSQHATCGRLEGEELVWDWTRLSAWTIPDAGPEVAYGLPQSSGSSEFHGGASSRKEHWSPPWFSTTATDECELRQSTRKGGILPSRFKSGGLDNAGAKHAIDHSDLPRIGFPIFLWTILFRQRLTRCCLAGLAHLPDWSHGQYAARQRRSGQRDVTKQAIAT